MLEITVRPERSERRVRPDAEELAGLVTGLRAEGDKFLIVQHVPDVPEYFIQTMRNDNGSYCLEHRDGGPDRQYEATLSDAAAVTAAIRGWSRWEAGWVGETDPERLTRAFEALETAGITARENYHCCRTCGTAAIGGDSAPDARGFVYFHEQCTEGAADGNGMSLLYGAFDGSDETSAVIGAEVVAALAAVGLATKWDGDPGRTIRVSPLDWRKRLVG